MTAHRDPAAIAADLRRIADGYKDFRYVRNVADEVEALPVLTEVAEFRNRCRWVLVQAGGDPCLPMVEFAADLAAFLDRIDPPAVEVQADEPDLWALIQRVVDAYDDPTESSYAAVEELRAALAERGAS